VCPIAVISVHIIQLVHVRNGLVEAIIRNVKRVCRGILNMRPVRDGLMEAIIINVN
jgi:hypothetical protein